MRANYFIICWDMDKSSDAVQKDFENTQKYLDELSAKTTKICQSFDIDEIIPVGDGQRIIIKVNRLDNLRETAEKTVMKLATQIRDESRQLQSDIYPHFKSSVIVGYGFMTDSRMGLTGPVLWNIHEMLKSVNRDSWDIILTKEVQSILRS